jgi:hypothetical protein
MRIALAAVAVVLVVSCGRPVPQLLRNEMWQWDGTKWTQLSIATPPARASHAMAYDSGRGVTVLFGGGASDARLNDTWEWDGSRWAQRAPPVAPPSRSGHSMAFDSARQVTVLFGGSGACQTGNGVCTLNDTWTWDGSIWTPEAGSPQVPEVNGPMAFDAGREVAVLVGSSASAQSLLVWEWNGAMWNLRTPAQSPPASFGNALTATYDPVRAVTVVSEAFFDAQGFERTQTWEWDGTTWSLVATSIPTVNNFFASVFDSGSGHVTLLETDPLSALTFTGSAWNKAASSPADVALSDYAASFDTRRNVAILFGGKVPYLPD